MAFMAVGRVGDSRFFFGQFVVALAALVLPCHASARYDEAPWPQVFVPQQVETFDIGQETTVNGTPVRMRGFVSHASADAVATAFRKVLGKPLVEDHRGNTLVLGRGEGRFYVTVQLTPVGSGTRGVIAVTKPPVNQESPVGLVAARHLLSALPPGSILANHTSSIDGQARSDHDAIINSHSIGINSEYVQRMLRADGFTLEHASGPSQFTLPRAQLTSDSRTLFFKGRDAEAIAVLFSDDSGKSVIVLNRIHFVGRAK